MIYNRRKFLNLSTKIALAGFAINSSVVFSNPRNKIKAIAFDAFPIFDPRPIFSLVKKLYPQQGHQFTVLWRTKIFEYTWLLTVSEKYESFWICINNALIYTAKQLNVNLSEENEKLLMNAFLEIKAFSDVKPVLSKFKASGIKLAFLSNMTQAMLNQGIQNSGLEGYFDHVLSTDHVKKFKPAPQAYQMAVDAFGLPKNEIAFAAFASWDVVGAKWFGYPTFWVNRLNFSSEQLGLEPDGTGTSMLNLAGFVDSKR